MAPGEDPDREVVARFQAGDASAFDRILERYRRPILQFAFRLLGDAAESDDVAQDVFVRAYRHLHRFRPVRGARFSTWLFQIARTTAIDRARRRRRTDPLDDAAHDRPAPGPDPRAEVASRETGALIAAAVSELPEEQRSALVLAEYEGMSIAHIAGILGMSEKSVEARLYRARQFLRGRLRHLLPG